MAWLHPPVRAVITTLPRAFLGRSIRPGTLAQYNMQRSTAALQQSETS